MKSIEKLCMDYPTIYRGLIKVECENIFYAVENSQQTYLG